MRYTFRGELCARVCKYVEVPLSGASVLLYRAEADELTHRVAARPRDTFRRLSPDQADARADRLLAEAETDDDGSYTVVVDGDQRDYDGGAVEVHVRVTTVAGHDVDPVQVSLTTIQPRWRKHEDGAVSGWDHCLARQEWCAVLEAAGLWVVAGHITDCETEEPLEGMTVTAFDADIIQHDALGSDTTNAAGEYVVYYTDPDVERVPFGLAPTELVGGPDLFFRIDSPGGTPLLEEEPGDGRQPGRENARRCECIDLCVDFTPGEGGESDPPLFTHVGEFNIFQDLESDGTLNRARFGHGGDGWGFFHSIPLEGYVPEVHPDSGDPVWYRFLYRDSDGTEHPLVGNLVDRVSVGGKLVSTGSGPLGFGWQEYYVVGNAPAPDPSLDPQPVYLEPTAGNADQAANGWVRVPDLHGSGLGHGPLLRFDTRNAPTIPGGIPSAGTPGTSPSTPSGERVVVIFETTVDDGAGNPSTAAGDVERQSETAPLYVNNYREVRSLDVVDEDGNPIGCDVAEGAVVRYTADHEFLHSYSVSLQSQAAGGGGPGSTWPTTLASANLDRASNPPGTATGNAASVDLPAVFDGTPPSPGDDYDSFADWPSCSYIARLTTRRALTNGVVNDDGDTTGAVNGVFYKG